MSDHDKMMAFGHWLTARRDLLKNELFALSVDRNKPIDAIRIKAGHVEDCSAVLAAFTELYNSELKTFNREFLGIEPEKEEEESETDGAS